MSRPINPLTKSEVDDRFRKLLDFDSQCLKVTVNNGPRSGKREFCIERKCEGCGVSKFIPVHEIRRKIKNSKPLPFKCRECAYTRKVITNEGYIWIYRPEHPRAYQGKYVPEHILTMEDNMGRLLDTKSESIHHINGDRSDNRIENLQLRQRYHGKGIVHKCVDCGSTNIVTKPLAG